MSIDVITIDSDISCFNKIKKKENNTTHLIKEIVKKSLMELAVSLAFVGVTSFFIATPAGLVTLLISSITVFALNVLFRSLTVFFLMKNPLSLLKIELSQLIPSFIFNFFIDQNTRGFLVHEGGHYLATQVLLKNPRTKISVEPFKGAQTSYRIGFLTRIGEFFGRERSKLIISAAGPFLSIIAASTMLIVGSSIAESDPELSCFLKINSISTIAQEAFYALSALWTSVENRGHDFLQLWVGGIHPVISIIAIIVLPIFIQLGYHFLKKIVKS